MLRVCSCRAKRPFLMLNENPFAGIWVMLWGFTLCVYVLPVSQSVFIRNLRYVVGVDLK